VDTACEIIDLMITEPVRSPIEPSTAGPDFWKRYHDLRRIRQAESRPNDPVRPDAIEENRLRYRDPFRVEHRYEITSGDRMLSWFDGQTVSPGSAEYESNKHLFWADAYVRPDHRRAGLAASWLPILLELVDRHGCTTIGMSAEEESGHAFLRWLGAEAKLAGAENRLKLADVDWKMLKEWTAAGAAHSPETKLEVYDGPLPEAMWADYGPQLATMLNTMPFEDLDMGEIVVDVEHMREFYTRLQVMSEQVYTVLTREPDGTISAVTEALWAPHRETIVRQMFTGVRPQARGRGLGKWVKAEMLLHLHRRHPEAQWVSTDNAGSNAPMLAINKRLGFKQFRAGADYQIGRDDLAARVSQLNRT